MADEVSCQTTGIVAKKRFSLVKKLIREANLALDAHDIENGVKAVAQIEKAYQFDVKNSGPTEVKPSKPGSPVRLKLHQGGSVESQRQQLLERIAAARGAGGNGGGSSGGVGVAGAVAGAG